MRQKSLKRIPRLIFSDWYRKLSHLFIAILLWQWFDVLQGYWWDQTFTIAHAVLIAGVVIEIVIPGPKWIRTSLQGLALLTINIVYTGFEWIEFPWRQRGYWDDWFVASFQQLDPFIWISLGVLALFLFAGLWSRSRTHVMVIIGACLLSLTITDSFTPIYLWDEIAWTVFIGLAWLIAEHFCRFQVKHPESWSHLLEYPAALILPTILILAVLMASGLFVPNINPIIKDPYTIWKESRGENVPAFLGDKGAASATSTGDSRSGYSRNDDELGGGFRFDYSEVMTVSTTRRSYWRGETKSVYTGEGWVSGQAEGRDNAISGLSLAQPLPAAAEKNNADNVEVTQTFSMIRKEPFPVLFGAATIKSIESLGEGIPAVPTAVAWLPENGELRWPLESSIAAYPSQYTVVSDVTVLDEAKIRTASTQDIPLDSPYLQLPARLPKRVKDLAQSLTANATNEYDKARAIETYLKGNFPYTNEPDLSRKKSSDFVDSFLFEIKEGYCDYYSTAMAVLARAAGLPSRWVKGYAPGTLPVEYTGEGMPPEAVDPNMGGTYTVRNADAHSWVEVYFEGYGWISFEPTAGFAYPYAEPENAPEPEVALPADTTTPVAPEEEEGFSFPYGWLAAGIAVLLAAALFIRRDSLAALWKQWRMRSLTGNQRIVWETEKLIRYAGKNGLERSDDETLRESMVKWAVKRRSLQSDFSEVLTVFEQAKYSASEATHEEAEQIAAKVKAIRERL